MPAALSCHEHPLPSSPRYRLDIRNADIANLVADRLRVNKLVLKIASWVASAMARRVELWDDNLVSHSREITSVAFSPDGTKIVSGALDKTIKVWDFGAPEPSNRPS